MSNSSIMNCVRRKCVYALYIGLFVCSQSSAAFAKEGKEGKPLNSESSIAENTAVSYTSSQFQWNEHNRLSWEDFRGAVNATTEESAAATHCGIGFKTKVTTPGGKPEIIVYNTFYTEKSWVRSDAKMSSILDHEQGHFDLCEVYTRKLRARMKNFDFNVANVKQTLMNIYSEISNEYEGRQQAYEHETVHGTNTAQQKKWIKMIANELM